MKKANEQTKATAGHAAETVRSAVAWVLSSRWRLAVLGAVALLVVICVTVLSRYPQGPSVATKSGAQQPEHTYTTTDGYSYAVSLADVAFDRANAKPGQVKVAALFKFRNVTDGHKALLPDSDNAQIVALDTSIHPECTYAKFRANPSACDLAGMTLKTRVGMFYKCSATHNFGWLDPGESTTCTQDLAPIDEVRYKQLGENALKNAVVGYLGAKNGRVDKARCEYLAFGPNGPGPYAEAPWCKPGYAAPAGSAKLDDQIYASDWRALGSKW